MSPTRRVILGGHPGEVEILGLIRQQDETIGFDHVGRDRIGADDQQVRAEKLAPVAFP